MTQEIEPLGYEPIIDSSETITPRMAYRSIMDALAQKKSNLRICYDDGRKATYNLTKISGKRYALRRLIFG